MILAHYVFQVEYVVLRTHIPHKQMDITISGTNCDRVTLCKSGKKVSLTFVLRLLRVCLRANNAVSKRWYEPRFKYLRYTRSMYIYEWYRWYSIRIPDPAQRQEGGRGTRGRGNVCQENSKYEYVGMTVIVAMYI